MIIDERKDRRVATKYGLKITGLPGVLSTAKGMGIIEKVEPYMDERVLVSGFRISKQLRRQILDDLNE